MGIILIMKKTYKGELIKSMNYLAKNPRTIFLGQSVIWPGNSMYGTMIDVPKKKKIELPVFEDMQMGMSIGLALEGFIPVSCYPRFDFLLLAFNQLINHLDKIRFMSDNEIKIKVIIRTSIGAKKPLDAGPQHTQDYTDILKNKLTEIKVISLNKTKDIYPAYQKILNDKENFSYLIVEQGEKY
jgi:pyruvate/2-oxoglutarate/acetoin dehydrogenase E1 component